ncbi:hypothetical protein SMICM17S_01189 [Streptomyces microflavus]
MPTTGLLTPRCSIFAMSRGRADSEEEVDRMSRNSRPRYFSSESRFTPATRRRIAPSTTKTKSPQVT